MVWYKFFFLFSRDDVHPSAMNDAVNTSADDDDDDSDDDNDENGEDEDEFDEENKNSPENGVGNSAKPTSAFLSRRRNIRYRIFILRTGFLLQFFVTMSFFRFKGKF